MAGGVVSSAAKAEDKQHRQTDTKRKAIVEMSFRNGRILHPSFVNNSEIYLYYIILLCYSHWMIKFIIISDILSNQKKFYKNSDFIEYKQKLVIKIKQTSISNKNVFDRSVK